MLGHVATHHLLFIIIKIVACDNAYTMESKDELAFVDFFPSSNTFCRFQLISHATCPRQLRGF